MDQVVLPDDSLSVFSRQVFTINGLLLRAGSTVAASCGTTVAKWHVLARANAKPRSVSEIARYIGISRQAVQQTADTLEQEGLVRYVDNPRDRRAQLVEITESGAKVLSLLYREDAVWSTRLNEQLAGLQLEQVVARLDPIITVLEGYLGGPHERS